jgi:hypothetical protein
LFAVAIALLRRAHAVDVESAVKLLSVPVGDFTRLVSDVLDVALAEPAEKSIPTRTGS